MTPEQVARIVQLAVDLLMRYPDCTVASALRLACWEDRFFYGDDGPTPSGVLHASVSERTQGQ